MLFKISFVNNYIYKDKPSSNCAVVLLVNPAVRRLSPAAVTRSYSVIR